MALSSQLYYIHKQNNLSSIFYVYILIHVTNISVVAVNNLVSHM